MARLAAQLRAESASPAARLQTFQAIARLNVTSPVTQQKLLQAAVPRHLVVSLAADSNGTTSSPQLSDAQRGNASHAVQHLGVASGDLRAALVDAGAVPNLWAAMAKGTAHARCTVTGRSKW